MSTQNKLAKLITRFEIGFDNETKADIDALKAKIDELTRALSVKNDSHGDRLLAAMQAEAANDAPQPELKQLGQWVFEGHDERLVTAFINANGVCRLTNVSIDHLVVDAKHWRMDSDKIKDNPNYFWVDLGGVFDNSDWRTSAIRRHPVNDVEYLSSDLDECVPHIDDAIDQSDWLSESVPQITQADMQHIFIKNLSEILIQRMHSMDRFSEDDYAIGGDKLMAWDIVIGNNSFNDKRPNFAIVIATSNIEHSDKSSFGIADLTSCFSLNQFIHTGQYVKISVWHNETYRTITEDELPAFCAALEACYA